MPRGTVADFASPRRVVTGIAFGSRPGDPLSGQALVPGGQPRPSRPALSLVRIGAAPPSAAVHRDPFRGGSQCALMSAKVVFMILIRLGRGSVRYFDPRSLGGRLDFAASLGVYALLKRAHAACGAAQMRAAMRSLVRGSHWPRARLRANEMALHDRCAHCGAKGALFHRFCDRPKLLAMQRGNRP